MCILLKIKNIRKKYIHFFVVHFLARELSDVDFSRKIRTFGREKIFFVFQFNPAGIQCIIT